MIAMSGRDKAGGWRGGGINFAPSVRSTFDVRCWAIRTYGSELIGSD
jgi:hypothetical protein